MVSLGNSADSFKEQYRTESLTKTVPWIFLLKTSIQFTEKQNAFVFVCAVTDKGDLACDLDTLGLKGVFWRQSFSLQKSL
jgi:hypothetical protein